MSETINPYAMSLGALFEHAIGILRSYMLSSTRHTKIFQMPCLLEHFLNTTVTYFQYYMFNVHREVNLPSPVRCFVAKINPQSRAARAFAQRTVS